MRAGFEIGSGIYITTVFPEETAKYLRDYKDEETPEAGNIVAEPRCL
jgi:galactose-1-phosphate uridylyltransferase